MLHAVISSIDLLNVNFWQTYLLTKSFGITFYGYNCIFAIFWKGIWWIVHDAFQVIGKVQSFYLREWFGIYISKTLTVWFDRLPVLEGTSQSFQVYHFLYFQLEFWHICLCLACSAHVEIQWYEAFHEELFPMKNNLVLENKGQLKTKFNVAIFLRLYPSLASNQVES